jgi:hypothetical protein
MHRTNGAFPVGDSRHSLRGMERTGALRIIGTLGVGLGVVVMAAGGFAGELGGFVTGYGLLVVLSAGCLLLGLAIRERLAHEPRPARHRLSIHQTSR